MARALETSANGVDDAQVAFDLVNESASDLQRETWAKQLQLAQELRLHDMEEMDDLNIKAKTGEMRLKG